MAREVRLRGGLDAVGVIAVVDGVQVAGEDLVLRPAAAELDREARLLDLAIEGALAAGVQVADELLRNRRSAFDDRAGTEAGEQGDRRDGQGRAGEQRSGPPAAAAAVEAVAPVQAVLE